MAKLIPLTKGYNAVVDDADFDWLSEFSWYVSAIPGRPRYARRTPNIDGRHITILMHRLLLPGVAKVDHRDGDGLNNQRSNLRAATASQNAHNRRLQRTNTSGFIGVSASRGSWRAHIAAGGRRWYLGSFSDPAEAARVRDAAALELHGEFASLNFPATPIQQGEPTR